MTRIQAKVRQMKIHCIGGGPAGLYFAISAKRRDAGHDITVIERDPPGATYGWGVVYWDNLLDMLFSNDMESARQIRAASRLWQEQEIRLGEQSAYLPGYGYSIERSALLEILTRRARDLGVTVRHSRFVDPTSLAGDRALAEADLVVAADGAGSTVRGLHEDHFGTRTAFGTNRYIWLGTRKVFDRFSFGFEQTPAGWLWFHAYPTSTHISTCIIECSDRTWSALGFDRRDTQDTMQALEKIFETHLDGAELISQSRGQAARWLRFMEVTNQTWYHGNIVLLGDAAHTTHFTIGSGTRLAMVDAVALAQSSYENPNPADAQRTYDQRRRGEMRDIQASARGSQAWFENIEPYVNQDASGFAYSMSSRQGQQPPWRYQKHLATQITVARTARRYYDTAQRWYHASKRGESPSPATTRPSAPHAIVEPSRPDGRYPREAHPVEDLSGRS
jgi:2-polyprenyl-6-methoxyphenol hydroxylase-like FAD-dependent oxidoreductase